MMSLQFGLLRIMWRQAQPATLTGGIGMGLLALAYQEVLTPGNPWAILIIIAQCFLLAMRLGQFKKPVFGFMYSRGYSRDSLWWHMTLASVLSVLTALLIVGLMIWTGLRSTLHDRLLHSVHFPVMAPRETWVPLVWLGIYLLIVPTCHYAWIRLAQPTKGSQGGIFMALAVLIALPAGYEIVNSYSIGLAWMCWILYVTVIFCLTLGGLILHRSLEVQA